jgi:hypothetical protein
MRHVAERLEKEAGLSPMGAAALVARFTQEAPGGPTAVNPSSHATGINQALGDRRPAGYGTWSLDQQLDYIIKTDLPREQRAYAGLTNAKTPEEGSIAATQYERAEGYNGRTDILTYSTPVQKVYDTIHRPLPFKRDDSILKFTPKPKKAAGPKPGADDTSDQEDKRSPLQQMYDAQHYRNVVIRSQTGASTPRSLFSVAQPFPPATQQGSP